MQNGYSNDGKFNQAQIFLSILVTKHDVKMRPIYYWTDKRIKAHIAICFMALSCMRFAKYEAEMRHQLKQVKTSNKPLEGL